MGLDIPKCENCNKEVEFVIEINNKELFFCSDNCAVSWFLAQKQPL